MQAGRTRIDDPQADRGTASDTGRTSAATRLTVAGEGGFSFLNGIPALYGQANDIFADGYNAGTAKAGVRVNW